VPEGDVLFRTAATLRRWLGGREVTAASTKVERLDAEAMVGTKVVTVEAWGKHLLVRLDSGYSLHTHLRMTGSWHVYRTGEPWRRPERQARVVLTTGERLAVCFNAPVVELLMPRVEQVHPSLSRLGPDILAESLEVEEIRRRADSRPGEMALGELLLDQRVVAGIGNIWRCEALFVAGHNPWAPRSALGTGEFDDLMRTAGRLMRANLAPVSRRTPHWVYRRAGRPCRRCGTLVESRRQGEDARTAYWCPRCQPAMHK